MHKKERPAYFLLNTVLLAVSILLFLAELAIGSVSLPFGEVMSTLFQGDPESLSYAIVISTRLPQAVTAVGAGIGLAIGGWLMQTLFRNPLAGPSILGITGGASLGVAVVMLSGGILGLSLSGIAGSLTVAGSAMAGALIVLLIVLAVSYRMKDHVSLLIFGIMLGHFSSALVSILQYKASKEMLRSYVLWGMGTFSQAQISEALIILTAALAAIVALIPLRSALNILLLGDDYATSLGVKVKALRWYIILIAGIVSGAVTAFCGPVSFIGLAVPHFARMVFRTSDHKILFIPMILIGAITGSLSDLLTRLLEIPLNAVTSAIGAPVVILILLQYSREKNYFG